MKELIYTRQAEQADAHYILGAQATIDSHAGFIPDTSEEARERIEKRIANQDLQRYVIAMAGSAIIGVALLIETPIPAVNKRGQYIDMMHVSEGNRNEEIEQRLITHAAQIAIMNSPAQNAESSFLRIDPLSKMQNTATKGLRLRGEDLARTARRQF